MVAKRFLILILSLLISFVSFCQNNIAGTWEGLFLAPGFNLGQPKLVVEIHNFKDSLFTGITHLYYKENKYEHYKIMGWYDKKDGLLVFREVSTIAVDLGIYANCLGSYMMTLRKEGAKMFQEGYWTSNIKDCSYTTNVWLQKKVNENILLPAPVKKAPVVKKPPAVEDKSAAAKPLKEKVTTPQVAINPAEKNNTLIKTAPAVMPAKIAQRETDVQSIVEIAPADKDSIKVEVYDNGDIDGDSVSVYEEHVQRIYKKMITAKPITFYVSLNKDVNPISHLRLVAESLGSIPPCTALMIVTTKSKRYEVRLSSNYNKNATVELFLKE